MRPEIFNAGLRVLSAAISEDGGNCCKYLDFVDIYAHLSEEERMIYQQEHAPEAAAISGFAERFLRQGEARLLRHLLVKRFGEPSDSIQQRIAAADAETLALWFDRALEARALEDIFFD